MPDIAADVTAFTALPEWKNMEREFAAGDVPHCRAVSAPAVWHTALLDRMARLTLELDPVEPSPVETGHPDLIIAGKDEAGKAPDIEACRNLIRDLALKPVSARRRLGVVMLADRLLPPAANSLLKLAEEPPSHACILFIMEDGGRLMPTLRSRARFTALNAPIEIAASQPPSGDSEWLAWIEAARAKDAETIAASLASWGAWAVSRGDFSAADRAERLRVIAETKNLSAAMLCDLLILALREEIPFEHLFSDFR